MISFKQFLHENTKPLYVSRKLNNASQLVAWAKENGFVDILNPDDMHVTIAYSKSPMNWAIIKPHTHDLTVQDESRCIKTLGNASVLRIDSAELQHRFKQFIQAGASYDHPDYQPHVTISYTKQNKDGIKPFTGILQFGAEKFEPIDEDK
jgi:hypothetical protein